MTPVPVPEAKRLEALRALDMLDEQADAKLAAIAEAAAMVCQTPIALVTVVEADRLLFKANRGLKELEGSPREASFCAHAIAAKDDFFEVPDTMNDPRFADNPMVTRAPNIRFYAGVPLVLDSGHRVGTLCVIDRKARQLDAAQRGALRALARAATLAVTGVALRTSALHKTEAMTAIREQLRAQYESTPAIMHSIGPDGRLIAVSDHWLSELGYTREEVLGRPSTDFLSRQSRELAEASVFPYFFSDGRVDCVEYQLVKKTGELIDVSVSAILERDGDGHPVRSLAVLKDITLQNKVMRELAAARDAAVSANQAKSRFLAGMSHELRTPLNGLLGYARLLRLDGPLNSMQNARIDAMLNVGTHLLDMITAVLDLTAIEANKIALNIAPVDLHDIAAQCLDVVGSGAEAKGLTLSLSVARGLPSTVDADATKLRQVLLNLLGNAVKFTQEGGVELRLRLAPSEGRVRIEVVDTGPGVEEGRRERLFHEFDRMETEDGGGVEGAGLGLSISARLMTLLNGQIGYEPARAGGSMFWLELPVSGGADVLASITQAETMARPDRPLRILVVDDVAMNREIAASFLQAAGHTVTCVEDGETGVSVSTAGNFDVILMDVRMPGISGLEATRQIRALPAPRGTVPIVGLTAQAFAEQIAACRIAGMNSYLAKPYSPEGLLSVVAAAVAQDAWSAPVAVNPEKDASPLLDICIYEELATKLRPGRMQALVDSTTQRMSELRHILETLDRSDHVAVAMEQAHKLAGSAGMCGMTRLSAAARLLDQAGSTNMDDFPAHAAQLLEVIAATAAEVAHMHSTGALARAEPAHSGLHSALL